MYHTFAPMMPNAMATSVTAHQGPSARWSREITRAWSASATSMPSVTIAPQMPGRIPGTWAKGIRQVLTGSTDPAGGAHLRHNRTTGRSEPAAGATFSCSLDLCAEVADSSTCAVTTHSPALMPRTRAVSEIGPLPGTTCSMVSSWTKRSPACTRPFTLTRRPLNLTVTEYGPACGAGSNQYVTARISCVTLSRKAVNPPDVWAGAFDWTTALRGAASPAGRFRAGALRVMLIISFCFSSPGLA